MQNCPQCGTELGSDGPAGLCPKCLILGAFDSSVGAEESGTQTIDTAAAEAGDDDFGRYRILRPLGEGGIGDIHGNPGHVYATHDYWVTAFAPFGGGAAIPRSRESW
jgi:hypothetical protein